MEAEAEFLRAVTPIIATNNPSAARAFVDATPPPSDISAHGPKALRAWGDLMYAAEQNEDALFYFAALRDKEPESYWPHFQIGRLKARSQDFAGALEQFSQCVAQAPLFAWGWYELLRSALELKDVEALARAAAGFCAADRLKLGHSHARALAAAAHFLFEQKRREDAQPLYAFLVDQNLADDLVYVRQAEYSLSKRDFATAIALLEPRHEARLLGDWGIRALAQAYREKGNEERAREVLAEIVRRTPQNFHVMRDYVRLLAENGMRGDAEAVLQNARNIHSAEKCADLRAIVLSETGDHAGLLELLESDPAFRSVELLPAIDRAITKCAYNARDFDNAFNLIDWRIARFGEARNISLCAINLALSGRNWHLARAWLAKLSEQDFSETPELRLKRFELHCFTGELALAKDALETLQPIAELPARFVPSILKFYAEIGDWARVYRMAMENLTAAFEFADMGPLIVRAVRKSSAHSEAISRIDELLAGIDTASLRNLRNVLTEDIADDETTLGMLLTETGSDALGAVRQRLLLKRSVISAGRAQTPKRFAIYYCTNRTYLGPSFVSLVSLVNSNRDLIELCDLFIIVDDPDACRIAQRLAAKLADALRIPPILIVPRSEIDVPTSTLKTSYGLFTAGHSLAEAAYYRIYFARHLLREERYEAALYIDSDTIVCGDLNPLFAEPERPVLRARLDMARPEVEAAILQHGLAPGRYFNSGVLAFNLRHAELAAALDRCAKIIVNSQETLIFQDQCALNIAFKDQFEPLDPTFNFFLDASDIDQKPEGAILHYLDRPKPWDPLYSGRLSRIWFLNWHALALHIGSDDAIALLNAANER